MVVSHGLRKGVWIAVLIWLAAAIIQLMVDNTTRCVNASNNNVQSYGASNEGKSNEFVDPDDGSTEVSGGG